MAIWKQSAHCSAINLLIPHQAWTFLNTPSSAAAPTTPNSSRYSPNASRTLKATGISLGHALLPGILYLKPYGNGLMPPPLWVIGAESWSAQASTSGKRRMKGVIYGLSRGSTQVKLVHGGEIRPFGLTKRIRLTSKTISHPAKSLRSWILLAGWQHTRPLLEKSPQPRLPLIPPALATMLRRGAHSGVRSDSTTRSTNLETLVTRPAVP